MGCSFICCHLSPAYSSLQICISTLYVMNYKASTNEGDCKCTFISSHNMRRNKSTFAIPLIRWHLNDIFTRSPPSWKKTGTRLFYRVDIMAIDGLVVQRTWAPFQYPIRRLIVRSREVSKPRDRQFELLYRCEIWQARRQQCCRGACQISQRSDYAKYKSRGIEISRDLTISRLIGYWNGAQGSISV